MGLLERPLISAFFLGFLTNHYDVALPLGIVLELYWLDKLRLGAIIPPSGTLSFILVFSLAMHFNWQNPVQLAIPLLVCIPFAYTAIWLEKWQRYKNDTLLQRLSLWLKQEETIHTTKQICASKHQKMQTHITPLFKPEAAILSGCIRSIWSYAFLYMCCFGCVYALFFYWQQYFTPLIIPQLTWNMLYGVGLLGAILSLRTKMAYAVLAAAVLIVFCI